LDDNGHVHGELFNKAAQALGISGERCTSSEEKRNYELPEYDKMLGRVKKLLALGESNYEEESKSAISKAYALMAKYNISLKDVPDDNRTFVFRPIGKVWGRVPSYVHTLVRTVSRYYFVKAIYM
jgi:hypothetical protein